MINLPPRSLPRFVCLLALFTAIVSQIGCGNGSGSSGSGGSGTNPITPAVAVPTVTSVSPATMIAGAGPTTLTVTGTGFTSGTAIQIGGVVEPTTYIGATQLTATIPASQLTNGSLLSVVAVSSSGSSASGTAVNVEIDNPAPKITSFFPTALSAGTLATRVAITGTGFVPSTSIQVNGTTRSPEFVTATQVNVVLSTADLATAGTFSLTATNPTPGGGISASSSLAINNPVPFLNTIAPTVIITGATTPATITVTGGNFVAASVAQINGSPRVTTYISATKLTFQLTAVDQATATNLLVGVINAAPGGGTSYTFTLPVVAATPTPVITSLFPSTFVVGGTATSIQVNGTNFGTMYYTYPNYTYPTVLWNGTPLVTNYTTYNGNNIATLYATVPASLIASLGTANITVSSPTATPAVSNALPVTITNPPTPTLTSISPASGPTNTAAPVTLNGTGFTAASTVAFNGTSLTTTFQNNGALTVTLPAGSVALPGNGNFTVTTPAPGGGTSAPLAYTAYIAFANNSMVYNPVTGLLYLSVPSSVGAPYGNSIVSMDPATGALGTPIPVGSEPNRLALTSDGLFLWVGLDGASAVRKVDLTSGTAGLQFALPSSGANSSPTTAIALAALPGATNSVVVAMNPNSPSIAIYDSGALRGTAYNFNYYSSAVLALQTDGTRSEIYAAGSSTYNVFTYSATGLTPKATASSGNYAASNNDDLLAISGSLYTDSGKVYDTEAGALLGTFYVTPTVLAAGPTTVDPTLGKVFVLDNLNTTGYPYNFTQIQSFSTVNFTTATGTIPVSAPTYPNSLAASSHLTRWGTNGLAFRTNFGIYSFRSNVVKDLSTTSADLGVTVAVSGTNSTGASSTYTATVTNAGSTAATNVALSAFIPSTAALVSATPSVGTCSTANGIVCNLGGLASGASATVTVIVTQTTAGPAILTAQVTASENDSNLANNQASATATITGAPYALAPTLVAISPAAIRSGLTDTTITLTGTGFTSGSTVQLGSTALHSSYTSATQMTAIVPAANLATLGWAPITVTTPAPGGGTTGALPLTVYSVLTVGVNHIVYDSYTRKIMASVGSGSATVTGNSIAAIAPETATIGTPINIGSQPSSLALTSDGQILYTVLNGSQRVARFNMLTQAADFTVPITNPSNISSSFQPSVATLPGTENTIALGFSQYGGNALYDFNTTAQTAAIRGQASGFYGSGCVQFYDLNNLLTLDGFNNSSLDDFPVTATGFGTASSGSFNSLGCFKLDTGILYSVGGAVINPLIPATQTGTFPLPNPSNYGTNPGNVAPDRSLHRTFFAVNTIGNSSYPTTFDSIEAFSNDTYLPAALLPLGFTATEGVGTNFNVQDIVRWGQDGLAVLTSGGHIYLLRGPIVTPQLLGRNTAATLASSSASTITHGAGNTLLTLTGSNFVPGVAVTWNGGYRTTTIVDATHLTVAIPASDLAATGTASLLATNPGAAASSAITVTVN